MSGDGPEKVGDLDPDRRVWVTTARRSSGSYRCVHLDPDCHSIKTPTPNDKPAGLLIDDRSICSICSGSWKPQGAGNELSAALLAADPDDVGGGA